MKHYFIRSFIPVFDRQEDIEERDFWSGKKTMISVLKYERWSYNYWTVHPTTIPKKIWVIIRAKIRRTGQLELGLFQQQEVVT